MTLVAFWPSWTQTLAGLPVWYPSQLCRRVQVRGHAATNRHHRQGAEDASGAEPRCASVPVSMMYSMTPHDHMSATFPSYTVCMSTCAAGCMLHHHVSCCRGDLEMGRERGDQHMRKALAGFAERLRAGPQSAAGGSGHWQ